MTTVWWAVLVASIGSWLLKFAGVSLPRRALEQPRVQRIARLLPAAMLAALIVVGLFDGGRKLAADWHTLAGFAAAIGLLRCKTPFLVVFMGAVAVTAVTRLLS